jgi:hypothetical protein
MGRALQASTSSAETHYTRRFSNAGRCIRKVDAGNLSWQSEDPPQPLSPLEQAVRDIKDAAVEIGRVESRV